MHVSSDCWTSGNEYRPCFSAWYGSWPHEGECWTSLQTRSVPVRTCCCPLLSQYRQETAFFATEPEGCRSWQPSRLGPPTSAGATIRTADHRRDRRISSGNTPQAIVIGLLLAPPPIHLSTLGTNLSYALSCCSSTPSLSRFPSKDPVHHHPLQEAGKSNPRKKEQVVTTRSFD